MVTTNNNTNKRDRRKQRMNKKLSKKDVSTEFPHDNCACLAYKSYKPLYNRYDTLFNLLREYETLSDHTDPMANAKEIVEYFSKLSLLRFQINDLFRNLQKPPHIRECWIRMMGERCTCSIVEEVLFSLYEKIKNLHSSIFNTPCAEFLGLGVNLGLEGETQKVLMEAIEMLKGVTNTAKDISDKTTEGICFVRDLLLFGAMIVSVAKIIGLPEKVTSSDKLILLASSMCLMYFHKESIGEALNGFLSSINLDKTPEAQINIGSFDIGKNFLRIIYCFMARRLWSKANGLIDFFEKYVSEISLKFKFSNGLSDLIDNFIEIVVETVNFVCEKTLGFSPLSIDDPVKTSIDSYVAELVRLEEQLLTGKRAFNINSYKEFLDLVRLSQQLTYTTKDSAYGRQLLEILRTQNMRIARLGERFMMSNINANGTRQVPLFIMICGQTNVGKSWFTALLSRELACLLPKAVKDFYGDSTVNMMTWYFPKSNDHHDGYVGQPIFIIDDYGQKRDSEQNPSPEFLATIDFINSEPFTMKMAEVSLKGQQFSSLLGLASTNIMNFHKEVKSIQCVEALLRRFHFCILLSVKRELSKDPNNYDVWTSSLDSTLIPYDPESLEPKIMADHYDIYLMDTSSFDEYGKYKLSKRYSFTDFVSLCKQKYKDLEREYISRLKLLNSMTFSPEEELVPHSKTVDPGILSSFINEVCHVTPNMGYEAADRCRKRFFFKYKSKVGWSTDCNGKMIMSPGIFTMRFNNVLYKIPYPHLCGLIGSYYLLGAYEQSTTIKTIPKSHLKYLYHMTVNMGLDPIVYGSEIIRFGKDVPRITDRFTADEMADLDMTAITVKVTKHFNVEDPEQLGICIVEEIIDLDSLLDIDVPEAETNLFGTDGVLTKAKERLIDLFTYRTEEYLPDDVISDMDRVMDSVESYLMNVPPPAEKELEYLMMVGRLMSYSNRHFSDFVSASLNVMDFSAFYTHREAFVGVYYMSQIVFEGDMYSTLLYLLCSGNSCQVTMNSFRDSLEGQNRDDVLDVIFTTRASHFQRQIRGDGVVVLKPVYELLNVGYVNFGYKLFGFDSATFVAFKGLIGTAGACFMIYKVSSYLFCKDQIKKNLEIQAESGPVSESPNDKILSDLKNSILSNNLCEVCIEQGGELRRVNYILFYKGTRFVTNQHCIDHLKKEKSIDPNKVITLRFFQRNTPHIEICLENIEGFWNVPNTEIGTARIDIASFPLRRNIIDRFVPANHLFRDKFLASWLLFDGSMIRDVSREVRTLDYEYKINPELKCLLGSDPRHKYKADGELYRSPGGVFYRCDRMKGDCGYPLFTEDKSLRSSRIFAIHAAGSSSGVDSYATYINRGHILEIEKFHDNDSDLTMSKFELNLELPEAHVNLDGYVSQGPYPNKAQQVRTSRITESKMFESLIENPFVKADLNQDTKHVCKRYSTKTKRAISKKLIETASRSVVRKLSFDCNGNAYKGKVLSFGEAICAENFEFLKSMNLGTSAGAPLIWEIKGISGKRSVLGSWSEGSIGKEIMSMRTEIYDYIYDNDCYDANLIRKTFNISREPNDDRYWDLSFLKNIHHVVNAIKGFCRDTSEGKYNPPIYIDYQKDELLKPGKDTRIFSAAPLWYTIMVRMYMGHFMDWCAENAIHNEIAIGVNPYGEQWDRLFKVLSSFDKKIPSDYKKYDTDANPEIMFNFFRVLVKTLFTHLSHDEQERTLLLLYGICYSLHIMDAFVIVVWVLGMASGNPLTALVNCWVQQILFRMVFIMLFGYGSIDLFEKYVKLITLGDDGLRSVSSEIDSLGRVISEVYSPSKVQSCMSELGYTMTSGTKDAIMKYLSDGELEFLKRRFVYNPVVCRVVAPLNLKSMLKMLYFTKQGDEAISYTNYKKFMLELSYHGKELYEKTMTQLSKTALERNVIFPVIIPWEEAVAENSARQYDVDEFFL